MGMIEFSTTLNKGRCVMAKKMLTKKEVVAEFRVDLASAERANGRVFDKVARRQQFGEYTDYLCKSGQISMRQYETWSNPF